MELVDIFGIWLIVATLGVTLAAPLGPINLEIIKQSFDSSVAPRIAWFSTLLIGIGAMSGDFIVAFSVLTIGGEVLDSLFSIPIVKILLFAVNLVILSYLGLSTFLKSTNDDFLSLTKEETHETFATTITFSRFLNRYLTGLSIVVTSPWSYLWWTSAGTIILFSDFSLPDLFSRLIIVMMFLSGIFLWMFSLSTILAIIGRSPNKKFFMVITKGSALILLLFAVIILNNMLILIFDVLFT
ncbi:MAG: LysE family transporter [Candidatus Hodarchaeales archaeon]